MQLHLFSGEAHPPTCRISCIVELPLSRHRPESVCVPILRRTLATWTALQTGIASYPSDCRQSSQCGRALTTACMEPSSRSWSSPCSLLPSASCSTWCDSIMPSLRHARQPCIVQAACKLIDLCRRHHGCPFQGFETDKCHHLVQQPNYFYGSLLVMFGIDIRSLQGPFLLRSCRMRAALSECE